MQNISPVWLTHNKLERLILPRKLSCFYFFSIFQERLQIANQINISTSALGAIILGENKLFLEISNAVSMRNLNWQVDQVGVFLDLAGDAHVDVLVANGDDHTADDRWIDLGCEMNGLVWLDEFLQWKMIIGEIVSHNNRVNSALTFNCDSNSLRCPASRALAVVTSQTTSPRCADMINLKALMTPSILFKRPFSASSSNKKPVAGANLTWAEAPFNAAAFKLRLMLGSMTNSLTFGCALSEAWNAVRSRSTDSSDFCLEAAE